jgi:uncharacterized protein YyaL (SSP411 family)
VNRLAGESSPYLRQHADNPVDWYPWGDDAFDAARRRDRPVFLSIGYSACHWCHVMAHESFEDPALAAALNDAFVSVKVDREERPDVDAVYMEAVQALTGSGGWPMSVFLTPDGRPFYGGTYFPPRDRAGMPGFPTVLAALSEAWTERRSEVETQADELARAVAARSTISRPRVGADATAGDTDHLVAGQVLESATTELAGRFDPAWGGFGPAPKFPQPSVLELLLRAGAAAPVAVVRHQAAAMVRTTLEGMAAGGIHDHLGGGLARYSTDPRWLVPHFEKMLYDQAGLLRAYLHGWQVTGDEAFLRVAERIVDYVARDLTLAGGALCSAEDADSEGEEGRFYVWTPAEIEQAVADADEGDEEVTGQTASAVADFFGVSAGPNFEGRSILHRPLGADLDGPPHVEHGRRLLRAARDRRPRPGLDDKVLTEWNAMYSAALAEGAALTGRDDWAAAATAVAEFLLANLRRPDGRWLRSWQAGTGARHLAYAGDYAWLIDCFTRLGELTGQARWTAEATVVADALIDLFHDDVGGGFFTTGRDAEALLVRPKEVLDGAVPSANGVAALALTRLGALTGSDRFTALAEDVVALVRPVLDAHPTAVAVTAVAADLLASGVTEVVVPGPRTELLAAVQRAWRPSVVAAWGESTGSPLWTDRRPGLAYVCRHGSCQLPAGDVDALHRQLAAAGAGGPETAGAGS